MALLDPYTGPWTRAEAAHLARRTTFGATPVALTGLTNAGCSAAVDSIVNYQPVDQALETQISNLPGDSDPATRSENERIKDPYEARDIEGWWLYRMVNSTQPFQQQFSVFLHDHFVSEYGKISSNVTNSSDDGNDGSIAGQACTTGTLPPDATRQRRIIARLLLDQHRLFLTLGHGSFRDMLIAITRDPCMLIYLDNRVNTKSKPQENYGREIMELFTMGVGNYSEEDVKAATRAFTGETIRTSCSLDWPYDYTYSTTNHDTNPKTLFGVTFNNSNTTAGLDTIQAIDLILNRVSNSAVSPNHKIYPATALYMSWKFLNWFVNDTIQIGHDAVKELADHFYNDQSAGHRYNVRSALRKLFKSQFFYDPANRLKVYKHPADYIVTALRGIERNDPSYTGTVYSNIRSMGMQLFEPPTVDGWHHGKPWINSSSLIARFNYANRMSTSTVMSTAYLDGLKTNGSILNNDDDAGIMNFFAQRLLLDSLTTEEAAVFTQLFKDIKGTATTTTNTIYYKKMRAALHLTMTMPRYQLK